ncbi:hypothetical protein M9H77_27817 [Catharanthus roseus]|uniref:Uncharacterized protein n=1 Tax=Catharanthus roseus TaxID=4058 RepID=A0ACC0AFQ6_CATRO|nr:hypothetical protein M9H77_27817 [Catharanthus roseus]
MCILSVINIICWNSLPGDQVNGLASRSLAEEFVAWIPVEGEAYKAKNRFSFRGRCPLRPPQGRCPLTPPADRPAGPPFSFGGYAPGTPLLFLCIRPRHWRQAHGDEDLPRLTFDFHEARGRLSLNKKRLYVLENPIPNQPANNATRVEKDAYSKHKDDSNDVTCLMLATMESELQSNSRKLRLMR